MCPSVAARSSKRRDCSQVINLEAAEHEHRMLKATLGGGGTSQASR